MAQGDTIRILEVLAPFADFADNTTIRPSVLYAGITTSAGRFDITGADLLAAQAARDYVRKLAGEFREAITAAVASDLSGPPITGAQAGTLKNLFILLGEPVDRSK